MDNTYARIEESDFGRQIRVILSRRVGQRTEYLTQYGDWHSIEEGEAPNDDFPAGIVVPRDMLRPLLVELTRFLNDTPLPSEAEVKVLREWLDAERYRTDRLFDKALGE